MKAHVDITGREIKPGDWIVYSASGGRSALLKFGRVATLGTGKPASYYAKDNDKYIGVVSLDYWDGHLDRWNVQNNGKPVRLTISERVLIVPAENVPERARKLLEGGEMYEPRRNGPARTGD